MRKHFVRPKRPSAGVFAATGTLAFGLTAALVVAPQVVYAVDDAVEDSLATGQESNALIESLDYSFSGADLSLLSASASSDMSWYVGHEQDTSYTLSTVSQLEGLAWLVNNGTSDFSGKTITWARVDASIMLSAGWTPIGTADHAFNGSFDGKGLRVNRMVITTGSSYLGLFGHTGSASMIKNVSVTGSITLTKTDASPEFMDYIGGVVGDCEGSLENCTSSVKIDLFSAVKVTEKHTSCIMYVGGVAGRVVGDVKNCSTTSTASIKLESSSSPSSSDISNVISFVGGVAGITGVDRENLDLLATPNAIEDCTNAANVRVLTYAKGALDRFNVETQAASAYVGGIAGYTTSNVYRCSNSGDMDSGVVADNIGKATRTDAATGATVAVYKDSGSDYSAGYGTNSIAGIVGCFRTNGAVTAVMMSDTEDPGLKYNKEKKGATAQLELLDCENTGVVMGLSGPGGIVGSQGSYTTVSRCWNGGEVTATRWNSPAAAGVVSSVRGVVSYCYNTADVSSLTGAAYYTSGIAGSVRSVGKDYSGVYVEPEVYACYNSGQINAEEGYRAGDIVGTMSAGYVHDCWSVRDKGPHEQDKSGNDTICGIDSPGGTIANCGLIEAKEFTSAATLEKLNALCDKDGWGVYYSLPEGVSYGANKSGNGQLFVLCKASYESATDLSTQSVLVKKTSDAPYSAAMDPVPTFSVTIGSKVLVQGADFRVVPQTDTKGVSVSDQEFSGTIVGLGNYAGTVITPSYKITQGSFDECTISTGAVKFNWEKQKPKVVTVYDAAGNEVSADEYTWDVDETLYAQQESGWKVTGGSEAGTYDVVPYKDAINKNVSLGYPITITAKEGSNYSGSLTQNCFKISQISLVSSQTDKDNKEDVVMNNIVCNGQTFKFTDVCDTTVTNGGAGGSASKRGTMKITYSGAEIRPDVPYVTYLGKQLKQLKFGDNWYENTTEWGYKIIYGDPNPEDETHMGDAGVDLTNVTKGEDYAVMTIRHVPFSNFDNFITVYYAIVPADISSLIEVNGFKEHLDSAADKQKVTLTYTNDYGWATYKDKDGNVQTDYSKQVTQTLTLAEGTDYTVTTTETSPGVYSVTYTGKGNYTGTITKQYSVGESEVDVPNRLSGSDRYATMSKIVDEGFTNDSCQMAVLATAQGDKFPDALAASSLAGSLKAPVLLTSSSNLDQACLNEIMRLGVKKMYVLGGELSVSTQVTDTLEGLGITVERVAGESRQATSVDVMNKLAETTLFDTVIVAAGKNFPDTLAISPYAYAKNVPIVLTTNDGVLTEEAVAAIQANEQVKNVIIVGGTASVSDSVKEQLGSGYTYERLSGANRYETSAAIAMWELSHGMEATKAAIATGESFPDALAGAALSGVNNSILLLAADGHTDEASKVLSSVSGKVETMYVYGGTSTVPIKVAKACRSAAGL